MTERQGLGLGTDASWRAERAVVGSVPLRDAVLTCLSAADDVARMVLVGRCEVLRLQAGEQHLCQVEAGGQLWVFEGLVEETRFVRRRAVGPYTSVRVLSAGKVASR
jgi:hypothetical protein